MCPQNPIDLSIASHLAWQSVVFWDHVRFVGVEEVANKSISLTSCVKIVLFWIASNLFVLSPLKSDRQSPRWIDEIVPDHVLNIHLPSPFIYRHMTAQWTTFSLFRVIVSTYVRRIGLTARASHSKRKNWFAQRPDVRAHVARVQLEKPIIEHDIWIRTITAAAMPLHLKLVT